ncbi:hypothetical protein B5G11_01650 [Drancourtella sp. An57]|nr:hypothetical protein B5G11_01650 [Drancourtella sp. An57]
MPDGGTRSRSYPLTREQVEMFASVYETDEYKQIAYPAVKLEDASEDRFTWEDSVRGTALQITGIRKKLSLTRTGRMSQNLRWNSLEKSCRADIQGSDLPQTEVLRTCLSIRSLS